MCIVIDQFLTYYNLHYVICEDHVMYMFFKIMILCLNFEPVATHGHDPSLS
jgi:hypothetical protein